MGKNMKRAFLKKIKTYAVYGMCLSLTLAHFSLFAQGTSTPVANTGTTVVTPANPTGATAVPVPASRSSARSDIMQKYHDHIQSKLEGGKKVDRKAANECVSSNEDVLQCLTETHLVAHYDDCVSTYNTCYIKKREELLKGGQYAEEDNTAGSQGPEGEFGSDTPLMLQISKNFKELEGANPNRGMEGRPDFQWCTYELGITIPEYFRDYRQPAFEPGWKRMFEKSEESINDAVKPLRLKTQDKTAEADKSVETEENKNHDPHAIKRRMVETYEETKKRQKRIQTCIAVFAMIRKFGGNVDDPEAYRTQTVRSADGSVTCQGGAGVASLNHPACSNVARRYILPLILNYSLLLLNLVGPLNYGP